MSFGWDEAYSVIYLFIPLCQHVIILKVGTCVSREFHNLGDLIDCVGFSTQILLLNELSLYLRFPINIMKIYTYLNILMGRELIESELLSSGNSSRKLAGRGWKVFENFRLLLRECREEESDLNIYVTSM